VSWRDLLAGEVLRRWEVSAGGRIREDEALPDRVGQHLAERDYDVADRTGRLPFRLELGDETIDVLGAQGRERPVADARKQMRSQVEAVALERRRREARPPASADAGRVAVREPALGVGGERLAAGLTPRAGVDLALARGQGALGFAAAGADRLPFLLAVDVVDDRVVAAGAFDDRSSCHCVPPIWS